MNKNKIYQPFRFRQFLIYQNKTAMKVGTDGVLLGAWTAIPEKCTKILDIGTGTGLIALMLAQRVPEAEIIGIEPDELAFEESTFNFTLSKWSDRLRCIHCDLVTFSDSSTEKFDLIVSNPPFHQEKIHSDNPQRIRARSVTSLSFKDLLKFSADHLHPQGQLSLILPFTTEKQIFQLADEAGLFPYRITRVRGTATSPVKRSLIQMQKEETNLIKTKEIYIEEERHKYSEPYTNLTKEFYI